MAEKVFFDIEARGTSKAIEQIDNLEKSLKKVAAAKKKEGANTKKLKALEMQLKAEKKRLNAEVNKSVREFNANKNAVKAAAGSYDQLVEKNKALVQQLRRVPDPLGKGKKEFQKLSKEINNNTDKLSKMDKAMGRSHRNVGNYADSLKKGAAVVGKYALAIGAAFMAVKKLFNATKESIDKFDQQVRAEVSLEVALGRTSKALLEQASALQQTTRFGDEATIQGQAFLAQMGLEEDAILKLTPAILDMAQAKGMDLKSAFDMVAKSVGSSTNALARYGIQFDGVVGSTERTDNALAALNEKFSGQAEAATAGAGKLVQLDNAYGDLQETIGGILVNAFEPFLASTHNLVKSFDVLLEQDVSGKLTTELKGLNGEIERQETSLLPLIDRYDELKSQATLNKDEQIEIKSILKAVADDMPDVVTKWSEYGDALDINTGQVTSNIEALKKRSRIINEEIIESLKDESKAEKERIKTLLTTIKLGKTIKVQSENGQFMVDARIAQSKEERDITKTQLNISKDLLATKLLELQELGVELSKKEELIIKEQGLLVVKEEQTEAIVDQEEAEKAAAKAAEKRRKQGEKDIESAYEHFAKIWADREKLRTQGTEATIEGMQSEVDALQEKLTKEIGLTQQSNEEFLKEEDARIQAEKALDQQVGNEKVALAQQAQDAIAGVLADSIKRRGDAEIEALEKQKEQGLISEEAFERKSFEIKRRGFRKLQAMKLAEIASNLASELSAIATNAALNPANALTGGAAGLAQYGVLQGMAVARAAINAATILAQKFEKGGLVGGGVFEGNSHAQGGVKFASGGKVPQIMEAEGGEAIINKRSTSMYKPLLSAINQAGGGKKFALGGLTPNLDNIEKISFADQIFTRGAVNKLVNNQEILTENIKATQNRIDKLKVVNVVSDTTSKQISINNVESEALF